MTDPRAATPTRSTLALAAVLAALCAAAVGPAYVNHDAAWYLYMADRWFAGATLYRDVVDTNPPLIVWLTSVPAAIARVTGVSAPALFKLSVFAMAALSLFAAHRIVARAAPGRVFVLTSLATFLCLPFAKQDFGQREHLAVLLTLPYVLGAMAPGALGGRALTLTAGVLAGLGFAIKPHFVLAWAALEAVVVATRGRRALRPELLAAAAAAAVYVVVAAVAHPEYLGVAGQVREVYRGLNSSPAVLLRLREVQLWLAAAALFAALRWPPDDRLPAVAFAAATGFLGAALLQLKGWSYHLYPARVFLLLFLAAAALAILERAPALATLFRGGRRGLGYVFAAVLVVASARYVAEARRPVIPELVTPTIDLLRRQSPEGVAVLSMRTIIYPAFPAVNYSGVSWGLRHNSLWFLPGFYADQDRLRGGPFEARTPEGMPPLEREFFEQIVADLCRSRPELLAFEEALPAAPAGRRALDLRQYYGQSARLRPLLDGYERLESVGPFVYWRRQGAAACGR
jgi:hypothetical protein